MSVLQSYPLLDFVSGMVVDLPCPVNISYLWNFGIILFICLVLQLATGIFLSMHYIPNANLAFGSVEHMMSDLNYGWLLSYAHANGASAFFIAMYIHIASGLYFGSYTSPSPLLWTVGVAIFLVTMGAGFIGYVLPFGQMSFWGATVITNMLSAIPLVGNDLVLWVWGGYSVDNPTLNSFYSFHFLLPFIVLALAVVHVVVLHETGSNNPLGLSSDIDKVPFHPYFTVKDIHGVSVAFLGFVVLLSWAPNLLGHTDNYIEWNPLATPAHIVPEWYFLPFYAMLSAVPNKLLGVITMLAAILILLVLPFTTAANSSSLHHNPLGNVLYWSLACSFLLLGWLGGQAADGVYVLASQLLTLVYFAWFVVPVNLTPSS